MAAPDAIAAKQQESLRQLREILGRNHPEATERLDRYAPAEGAIPNSYTSPEYFGLFMAESVLLLAEKLDELVEERKPKKRGRPRGS